MPNLENLPPELGGKRLLDTKQAALFSAMSVVHFRRVSRDWEWVRIGERKKAISLENLIKRIEQKSEQVAA